MLFKHARDFFWIFVLWRKYKVQVVARVERKSAVVLSGTVEASYPHFFVGIDFDRFSRIHFPPLRSKGGKSILEKWSRGNSSKGGTSKKNRQSGKISAWKNITNKVINLHATPFQNISKFTGNTSRNTSKSTSKTNQIRLGGHGGGAYPPIRRQSGTQCGLYERENRVPGQPSHTSPHRIAINTTPLHTASP